jgi:hypothetical protein
MVASIAGRQATMNPLPTQMADHWWQQPGRLPGRPLYHWHMLFHDQPEVRRLAAAAQHKLAGLAGLEPVPEQWLHLTAYIIGFADEVPRASLEVMTAAARQTLAGIAPIPVTLGRWLPRTEITIRSVSLVAQTQIGRTWQWRSVAEGHLAGG